MSALQNKSIIILIIACTLTMCTMTKAYDAWPSDFEWISPQTLTLDDKELTYGWHFHLAPHSYYRNCNYNLRFYLSKDQAFSSDDHLFLETDNYIFAGTTYFESIGTVFSGPSSLPENGTYYVFLELSPTWDAPEDTDSSNNVAMDPNPIQVLGEVSEKPKKTINPNPNSGAADQPINVDLSWSNGGGATTYEVYFGTDPTTDESEYKGNQTKATYNPGLLLYNTTYYWRIDAKNLYGTAVGDVWSFTTIGADAGKIIYVDEDATGANNGSSWDDAYKYLQDALAEADSSKKPIDIRIAQGIYKPDRNSDMPSGTGNREAAFLLINEVTINGGYAGPSGQNPDHRDIDLYETILNGDLNGNDDPGFTNQYDNSYNVVVSIGTDETAVLDGFTITAGYANVYSDAHHGTGGGMYNEEGTPTITNCTFIGNSAKEGGGIYNDQGSPSLSNCSFIGNSADNNGGGIYNDQSDPILTNCTFLGNLADNDGGGIYNGLLSNSKLHNCMFSGNTADKGGGIYNSMLSDLTLINCTFSKNSADDEGSGMFSDWSINPILTNCIMWNNTPDQISQASPTPEGTIKYSNIQGGFVGEGNIDADPHFADPDNGDYHLSNDSPCIGAGIMAPGVPNTDIEGNPRPNPPGSKPDMGAYENGPQLKASNPIPADMAAIGQKTPVLSWIPGDWAVEHDVYLGTDFIKVKNANTSDSSGIYRGRLINTAYVTEELDLDRTYYWRIDEVDADGSTIRKGDVWSFTIVGQLTVEYQVSSSEDDGYATGSNLQNLTADYLKVGSSSFGQYVAGIVFRNLNIPQGSEIVSAHLKIRSYNSRLTDIVFGMIEAEATDNAPAFDDSRQIGSLTKTNAAVDWDIEEPWSADTLYTSPDIVDVIQEVFNRSGWSAGNSLAILCSTRQPDGGYRNFSSYDHGSDYAPKLEITYVP